MLTAYFISTWVYSFSGGLFPGAFFNVLSLVTIQSNMTAWSREPHKDFICNLRKIGDKIPISDDFKLRVICPSEMPDELKGKLISQLFLALSQVFGNYFLSSPDGKTFKIKI